jgi:integrase
MSLYKQEGSPYWWASISVPGVPRLRRSTGTENRKEAERIHDQWKAELWELKPADAGPGRLWSEAVDLWLDAEERSESELLSLAKLGKRYPDRPLIQCTAESFEKAMDFCKTAGTWTRYRTMITAILNLAKTKKWVAEVPVIATKKDKKKKRRDWITRDQWNRLYAELPPHLKPAAEFAIETGLRQAVVLNLRWDQVDLERAFAWVEAEDQKDDDALPVPLSERALEVLKVQLVNRDLVDAVSRKLLGLSTKEYVFTFRGKPISDVKTAFMAACKRAGLGDWKDGKWVGFTWHGLRHTWATWHVQNKTPLDVLQKLGGWADLRMVMNYAHHDAGHLAQYANNARGKKGGDPTPA